MKHIFSKTKAFLIALCVGWGMLSTGCITEDLEGCYTLTLKVVNAAGEDITGGGDVIDAGLYIYDETGKYLETVKLNAAQIASKMPVQINYPSTANLKIVAWGNTEGSEQVVSAGSTVNDHTLQLANRTSGVMEHPRDLFFGDEDIPLRAGVLTKSEEVVIRRKVGRIEMRTENLEAGLRVWREQNGLRADEELTFDFYFNKSLNQVNSDGSVDGEQLSHNPYAELTEAYEFETPEMENVLPGSLQEGAFNINGEVFEVEDIDYNTGERIVIAEDQETLIIFEWGADTGEFLGIRVQVRPWGYVGDEIVW